MVTYDCASNIADQIDQQESYEQKSDTSKDNLQIVTQALCDDSVYKTFLRG